jgi:hypothetical protein
MEIYVFPVLFSWFVHFVVFVSGARSATRALV